MPSSLIVEVVCVEEVADHPNADRLQLARVKQWWTAVKAGAFAAGDLAVYVPPDVVLPEPLAEAWGVAPYCSRLPQRPDGTRPPGLRTRAARLRGVPSFGFLRAAEPGMAEGESVVDRYGLAKFEPPAQLTAGDAVAAPPGFHRYTDLESFGNFPGVFADSEPVLLTEKIHGTNCRLGLVATDDGPEFFAGSSRLAVAEFSKGRRSLYWTPMTDAARAFLTALRADTGADAVLFGEVFGPKVQDMSYGRPAPDFRAFDASAGGRYLDHADLTARLAEAGVPQAPVLYEGPFSPSVVAAHTDGPTTLCDASQAGRFAGREGVVVRPPTESFDPQIGRRILKSVSADYLARGGKATDNG